MLATGGWLMHYGEPLTPFHQLPQDYQKLIVKTGYGRIPLRTPS
jgi:hypothetical protein